MFTKEWVAEYQGNRIVVTNSFGPTFSFKSLTGEAKLYINGSKVDTCTDAYVVGDRPSMRGSIKIGDGSSRKVEVFMKSGLLAVKAKIYVDGVRIAGDYF